MNELNSLLRIAVNEKYKSDDGKHQAFSAETAYNEITRPAIIKKK